MSSLIDRQAAIAAVYERIRQIGYENNPLILSIRQSLRDLPSAQTERKKGKWVNGTCNQCGSHAPYWPMASTYYESNFCPFCGADMKGEKDE